MKALWKDALILTAITLVSGVSLGLVHEITAGPIATAEYNAQQEAYKAVFEDADKFEDYSDFDADEAQSVLEKADLAEDAQIDGVEVAEDSSGKTLGYVINVTDHNGYGGDVSFSLGIKNDGTLNGISFTTLNETAGLGQKAKEPKFSSQFTDKKVSGTLEVVKTTPSSDNQIEAISGATITSRAVTGGANAALAYFNAVLGGGSNE
jgi:electron transport complex protein RnfG